MIRSERQQRDGVDLRVLTLDRPEQRNAMTPGMLTGLLAEVNKAESNREAILLRGEGRCFCAGFDLELCRSTPDGSAIRLLLTGLSDVCRAMRRHPRPVVIAAHGAAIAGGCALLGGADLVVATRMCKLGYPVVRLGVSPAVTVPLLRLSMGDGGARHCTLLPDLFDGSEAARCGLVQELVDTDAAAHVTGLERAYELASKPAGAYAATKRWLNRLEGTDADRWFDDALSMSLGLTGGSEEATLLGTRQPTPPAAHAPGSDASSKESGNESEERPHG